MLLEKEKIKECLDVLCSKVRITGTRVMLIHLLDDEDRLMCKIRCSIDDNCLVIHFIKVSDNYGGNGFCTKILTLLQSNGISFKVEDVVSSALNHICKKLGLSHIESTCPCDIIQDGVYFDGYFGHYLMAI